MLTAEKPGIFVYAIKFRAGISVQHFRQDLTAITQQSGGGTDYLKTIPFDLCNGGWGVHNPGPTWPGTAFKINNAIGNKKR